MPKNFYSTTEVANILRVSRIAVFNRIKYGKLKAVKIGRNYIVNHEDLLDALGKTIGSQKKQNIDRVIDKALQDYRKTFELLGRE